MAICEVLSAVSWSVIVVDFGNDVSLLILFPFFHCHFIDAAVDASAVASPLSID